MIEATIDWVDEDVPVNVAPEVVSLVGGVRDGIVRELALSEGAERLRSGLEVAILGAPNAGKSTLINTLAGRDAAITSPSPGTTRDVFELRYDLAGLPVVFLDTAGLREAVDEVENIGVERAVIRAEEAALRLFLRAADAPPPDAEAQLWRPGDLRVWSKRDLGAPVGPCDLEVSARTGAGVADLLERVGAALSGSVCEDGLVGHLRQKQALELAESALARALNEIERGEAEKTAEELRGAFRALERLLGRIGVENVLDVVFSTFCLGK